MKIWTTKSPIFPKSWKYWKSEFCVFYKKDARRKIPKIGPENAPRSLIRDPFRPGNQN